MLVHTLRQCTADEREQLRRVFSVAREQRTERDLVWVFRLFERYASIDFAGAPCGRWSRRHWTSSTSPTAMLASADRDFIRHLIPYLGHRAV
jgi:geranylgeranyl diphosphate synthase, type II